ncbi:Nitroreductase [Cucurbitaria berberidis CBS 394.84]|uniref:Nitroreductase n=1 Tax=Cucurbitaria berberidis CBS 394.84 TaxID=1168544 RepID=A0A9P4G8M5_9PLEO|nr:Nitroreductase [Cucurbitaria berberidis CBS 394.84]KAF1840926.1 Nitroreductase [Cucurbitaria berberidis CBS 394.84]
MASTTSFLDAIVNRRSVYTLTNTSPISQSRISEIVHEALKYCPSAFNVRSSRCIILFGVEHTALWDHAAEVMPKVAPAALQDLFVGRIPLFKAGYGTVLFFEDTTAKNLLPPAFVPLFKEYPEVDEHASGMIQFIVWTALAAEGLGCNLQHYQPSITPYVKDKYNVPETWELKAQLVFGQPTAGPGPDKERTHLEIALKSYGGDEGGL